MKNRKDGKMFITTVSDILAALTAVMKQVGIILQANVFKVTSKTISESTAQNVGNGYMHGKVG